MHKLDITVFGVKTQIIFLIFQDVFLLTMQDLCLKIAPIALEALSTILSVLTHPTVPADILAKCSVDKHRPPRAPGSRKGKAVSAATKTLVTDINESPNQLYKTSEELISAPDQLISQLYSDFPQPLQCQYEDVEESKDDDSVAVEADHDPEFDSGNEEEHSVFDLESEPPSEDEEDSDDECQDNTCYSNQPLGTSVQDQLS